MPVYNVKGTITINVNEEINADNENTALEEILYDYLKTGWSNSHENLIVTYLREAD